MKEQRPPTLVVIPEQVLMEKLREVIRAELHMMSNPTVEYAVPGLTQKPVYKASEICKLLSISRQTLHTWVREGILKPHKIKSRVFFLWTDIEELIGNDPK